jgi:hypothetical protein
MPHPRDALLDALLPAPSAELPALAALPRARFWQRFAAAAPWSLRAGFTAVALGVVWLMPWVTGVLRPWGRLDQAGRDEVLMRTASLPGGAAALEIAKLVACFAYFDDAGVQATVRGPSRGAPCRGAHAP